MSVLNRKKLRQYILDYAANTRSREFTQVSASVYDEAEGVLLRWARDKVNRHPSTGTTIK